MDKKKTAEDKLTRGVRLLLAFMFLTNMIMAATVRPAVAVVLELVAPRRARSAAELPLKGGG